MSAVGAWRLSDAIEAQKPFTPVTDTIAFPVFWCADGKPPAGESPVQTSRKKETLSGVYVVGLSIQGSPAPFESRIGSPPFGFSWAVPAGGSVEETEEWGPLSAGSYELSVTFDDAGRDTATDDFDVYGM